MARGCGWPDQAGLETDAASPDAQPLLQNALGRDVLKAANACFIRKMLCLAAGIRRLPRVRSHKYVRHLTVVHDE